jgi:hypothetical protein
MAARGYPEFSIDLDFIVSPTFFSGCDLHHSLRAGKLAESLKRSS